MIHIAALIAVASLLVASLWGWSRVLRRVWNRRPVLVLASRRLVPWTIVDLCFCVALFALLQMMGGALVWGAYDLDPVAGLDQLPLNARAVIMLVGGIATLVTMLSSIAAIMWHTRATWRDLGFDGRFIVHDLRLGLAAFVLLAPPVYGVQLLLVQWFPSEHPLINLLKEKPDPLFLAITVFTVLIVAPFAEEYFFRVLLQGWLHKVNSSGEILSNRLHEEVKTSQTVLCEGEPSGGGEETPAAETTGAALGIWPIFASALIFSLLHASHGPDPIPLFLLAVGLGFLYRQTHRILPCIMVHLLLNLCSLSFLMIAILQPD